MCGPTYFLQKLMHSFHPGGPNISLLLLFSRKLPNVQVNDRPMGPKSAPSGRPEFGSLFFAFAFFCDLNIFFRNRRFVPISATTLLIDHLNYFVA
jgi:hypothetical protein